MFSLRRGGVSYKDNIAVKLGEHALRGHTTYGPRFGGGHDIYILNQSNTTIGNKSNFGFSYNLPNGYTYGGNAKDFLAGDYDKWTATEIEVYQII